MPLPRSRSFQRLPPRSIGSCDRCGFDYYLSDLMWQFDYRGPELINLRILVCEKCLDQPQDQLKPIILPPDPVPVQNPRPNPNMLPIDD